MTHGIEPITYLCSEIVSIIIGEPDRHPRTTLGNLEEIAAGRALVLMDTPVPRGAEVVVKSDTARLKGHAKRWDFEPALGYFVDVQLAEDSRWSEDRYRPSHLLPMPAIAA